MYNRFALAKKYVRYYLSASNGGGHGIHSPFVFNFIKQVLNDDRQYAEYEKIESLRKLLLNDNTKVEIQDFGAGSFLGSAQQRTISSIAKNAVKSKKYAQLLYRLIKFIQPNNILELGTSLGFTTAYFSLAQPSASIQTIEAENSIAVLAEKNFEELGCSNIKVTIGNFDAVLHSIIESLAFVDFCFIDGNHRGAATLKYFQLLLPKMNNLSVLVFDDIHWSRDMESAWEEIKKCPEVRCTIDLFFIGIVFFKNEFKEQQHFTIRF
ncbi:MAG: SAM-dependent methyltransferase [Chitinophagaceae bacterium]|nr:MAG: SAM-dependent methyltransferase [Chitinophagaceae bacterium]